MSFDKGLWQINQTAFRAEMRNAFTVRRPSALMTITGLTDDFRPPPINLGRLYTRHMRGIIEMERAERRKRRQGST